MQEFVSHLKLPLHSTRPLAAIDQNPAALASEFGGCSFPFLQRMRGHLDIARHRPATKHLPRESLMPFHLGVIAAV